MHKIIFCSRGRVTLNTGFFLFGLTMLNLDRSCFQNGVDLDQLASEKPADLGLPCFPFSLLIHANNGTPTSN